MDRRELIGFLAGVPMLAALADEVAASPSQKSPAVAAKSAAKSDDALGAVGTKLLYENDRVKVWEFALAPGEMIPMHTHTMDYLFHVYEGSTLEVTFADNSPTRSFDLKDGDVRFVGKGSRHTARNVGTKPYVEVLVEMKG
ncbi:MAG TPA: cupin domain-containing protein [Pyrinomonadaceae bacterium]|nr:cupin domain-containing protein [Pyrinomonadaceae bacterium]